MTVAEFIHSKGYPLTNSLGIRDAAPDDQCIGIFERRGPSKPMFVIMGSAFFFNRRKHLANLWLSNPYRGADDAKFVMAIQNLKGRFEMEVLAEKIAERFNVTVKIVVEGENMLELWSSSELPEI